MNKEKNIKILLVDDEIHILNTLQKILVVKGFNVKGASNGSAALKELESNSYDVLITDIMMPGLSGYELVSEARRQGYIKNTKVIFMSAVSPKLNNIQEVSIETFLKKPFSVKDLIEILNGIKS